MSINMNPFDFKQLTVNKFSDLDKPQDNQKDITDDKTVALNNLVHKYDIINNKFYTYTELAKIFSLLPVKSQSKEPLGKWAKRCVKKFPFNINDYKDSDGNLLNAGIACGPASGLIVLDIDDWSQFENWCKSKGLSNPIPETFTVKSGGKSQHYYFKYPEDGKQYKQCRIPCAKFIGISGYVVAPGSIHPSGKPYFISKNIPIAAAPQWILNEMINNKPFKKRSANTHNIEKIIPAPVVIPVAHNIQRGVLSAIIEVSQSRNNYELPTNLILKTYNLNAPDISRVDSDKSFGRLLTKTLSGYNIQFTKKKLSINGKTPQGIIFEQEILERIKELLNQQSDL